MWKYKRQTAARDFCPKWTKSLFYCYYYYYYYFGLLKNCSLQPTGWITKQWVLDVWTRNTGVNSYCSKINLLGYFTSTTNSSTQDLWFKVLSKQQSNCGQVSWSRTQVRRPGHELILCRVLVVALVSLSKTLCHDCCVPQMLKFVCVLRCVVI